MSKVPAAVLTFPKKTPARRTKRPSPALLAEALGAKLHLLAVVAPELLPSVAAVVDRYVEGVMSREKE